MLSYILIIFFSTSLISLLIIRYIRYVKKKKHIEKYPMTPEVVKFIDTILETDNLFSYSGLCSFLTSYFSANNEIHLEEIHIFIIGNKPTNLCHKSFFEPEMKYSGYYFQKQNWDTRKKFLVYLKKYYGLEK